MNEHFGSIKDLNDCELLETNSSPGISKYFCHNKAVPFTGLSTFVNVYRRNALNYYTKFQMPPQKG